MLIIALLVAACAIAYASPQVMARREQKWAESMTSDELKSAIEEGYAFCEDVTAYLAEQERRKSVLVNHRSEWVN